MGKKELAVGSACLSDYTDVIGWVASYEMIYKHAIGLWVFWAALAVRQKKIAPTNIKLLHPNVIILNNLSPMNPGLD